MAQGIGVLNAFWMAGIIIAKAEGYLTWAWWLVFVAAAVPFVVIGLLCWWAVIYDISHQQSKR